jgi:hypothetical protein
MDLASCIDPVAIGVEHPGGVDPGKGNGVPVLGGYLFERFDVGSVRQ